MLANLLKQISEIAISLGEQDFSTEALQLKWLGHKPASAQAILVAEKRLNITFPKDYKDFLEMTNGFSTPNDSTEPSFIPVEEIGYLKDLDSELIEIWSEHDNLRDIAQQLESSIKIGDNEQIFLLIPPMNNNENWKYWKFASWIPGEYEYDGLNNYFKEVLDFLKS